MDDSHLAQDLPYITRSLCPVCQQVLDAEVYEAEGKVWMAKTCPEHGRFRDVLSSDVEFYLKLRRTHRGSSAPVGDPRPSGGTECPLACGPCERHLSSPVMVNIDLTNRCNLNCPICFANANATGTACDLDLDQLNDLLERVLSLRPRPSCIQFAGGEPTVHPDFIEAVRRAKAMGATYVQVATNGLRFAQSTEFCEAASEAGLAEAYLQFDGVTDDIYRKTRGRPLIETKIRAVENLANANIRVILVPTLVKGFNDHQVGDILRFALEHLDAVSAISWQPVALTGRIDESKRLEIRYTTADLARDIQEQSGIADMHRDWYPFSAVQPFVRLVEAVRGGHYPHYNCHPNCGCATYLVVDKHTGAAVPIPRFVDIEETVDRLDRITARIERHPWTRRLSVMQAMRQVKKHFHPERAPEGWDFEHFLAFIRGFINIKEEMADRAGYVERLRRERFATLLLASMHFQDDYNYDLERVRRCVIHYAAPDGGIYPFCTWNSGPCHRRRFERQLALAAG